MRHTPPLGTRFFFATSLLPCPYLPGRLERRVVTELAGRDVEAFHDTLSAAGFRRSHDIAYAPACPDCTACRAVRIVTEGFRDRPWQRRIRRANADLGVSARPAIATREQYELFAAYEAARHGDGDMAHMDFLDYAALIENTPVATRLLEFRSDGRLLGACLVDTLGDGLSCVYSFFDPTETRRSLGSHMILWVVEQAVAADLPFVYLGFYVAGCRKMSYKTRFQPLEVYTPAGWEPFCDA